MAVLGADTTYAAPPVTALPDPATNFVHRGAAAWQIDGLRMMINQQSQRAVLNWRSFNIGRDAAVHFGNANHGASSSTVNMIGGNAPSEIFGRLTADGQVILFNGNGVVFGPTAQVDVRSLMASALLPAGDIEAFYDRFMASGFGPNADVRIPVLQWNGNRDGFEATYVEVQHGASIKTRSGGSVTLFAPKVRNLGTIETPDGQTILAAGERVYLAFEGDPALRGFVVEVDPYNLARDAAGNPILDANGQPIAGPDGPDIVPGEVTNDRILVTDANGMTTEQVGRIIAERGNVTLAGYVVNQKGHIRATTAVNRNGSIILKAGDTPFFSVTDGVSSVAGRRRRGNLTLGEDSVTEVVPDDESGVAYENRTTIPRADEKTVFNPSTIDLAGRVIELQERSVVRAPGGDVKAYTYGDITALDQPGDGIIYIANNAVIDVSGIREYAVPMERNFIPVRLLGNDLRDVPPQRDGILYRQEVWIDIRRRPKVANFEGHIDQVGVTVGELSTRGGSVQFKTEGTLIMRENSRVDVSGGSVRYRDGFGRTTQLRDESGRVYDIGDAPAGRRYVAVANSFTRKNPKWNWEKTWAFGGSPQGRFYTGYVEGRSGGSADMYGHSMAIDGDIRGNIVYTPEQRLYDSSPLHAALRIGNTNTDISNIDYETPDIEISRDGAPLPSSFTIEDAIAPEDPANPDAWRHNLYMSADRLNAGGVGDIGLYSNETIRLTEDASLNLPVSGKVVLQGRRVEVDGDISAPGGNIELRSVNILNSSSTDVSHHAVVIGARSEISARGRWINEWAARFFSPASWLNIDGGSVEIDAIGNAVVSAGSVIDVTGGGHVDSRGRLTGGKGGSIDIASGDLGVAGDDTQRSRLTLGGELRGYGIAGGGTLSLSTSRVRVGGADAGDPLELHLDPSFFQRGGFSNYSIKGRDGLVVAADTHIHPVSASLVLKASALLQSTGADIMRFANIVTLPVEYRTPTSLALDASGRVHGRLIVEPGAVISTDPLGSISLNAGRHLLVDGALDAPAGTISLSLSADATPSGYFSDRSLWLGAEARLSTRGAVAMQPNDRKLALGEVLDGGTITLDSTTGFLVTEQGSLVDVSGTGATLDVSSGTHYERRDIAGHAGRIVLKSREGMMLDGRFAATGGGPDARGGTLDVTIHSQGSRAQFAPGSLRTVVVRDDGTSLPAGMVPGDTIADVHNGKAQVAMDRIRNGGFDSLALKAEHRIEFAESTSVSLRRNLVLDAPIITAAPAASVDLTSAYFALANSSSDRDFQTPQTAAIGSAMLDVTARMIDLKGNFGLDGFANVHLNSASDIRLVGVPTVVTLPGGQNELALNGSLTTAADLTLAARQIYPTTMSDFTITLNADPVSGNPDGMVATLTSGAPSPVLSAAGKLTVNAPNINHGGAFKAPFGEIVLNAADSLVLADGSVTSVSAEGMTVPFGRTELQGRQLVYDITGSEFDVIESSPQKQIRLNAPNVTVAENATVNLDGGGDTLSYEFVPGPPGRTTDLFDSEELATSFAILPWLNAEYAPYDHQYQIGRNTTPGESVYLAGMPGLNEGTYAKLPARYAILPGAFLVTPTGNHGDMPVRHSMLRPDGTTVVRGYNASMTSSEAPARDARYSGFSVKSSERTRWESEYSLRYGSEHFRDGAFQLPADAGRLVIDAANALSFAGNLRATPANGGRGGEVDITALNLAVASADDPDIGPNFVRLDHATIGRFSNASLLLGGTRRATADGTEIDVRAQQVVIADNAGDPLNQPEVSAPEVLLVASDNVTVRDGAVVEGAVPPGSPAVPLNRADLILPAQNDAGTPSDPTDDPIRRATLIRVSSGDQVGVRRPGRFVDGISDGASYTVAPGATLRATGSMILDDSGVSSIGGTIDPGNALAIGAARIALGSAPTPVTGVALSGTNLAQATAVDSLTLRSYTAIDLGGDIDIGVNNLTLEAAEIRGHGAAGSTAAISAGGSIGIGNPGNNTFTGTGTGAGNLELTAARVNLHAGNTALRGFATVTANASEVRVDGSGSLDTAGALTINTPLVSAAGGTKYEIRASGDVLFAASQPAVIPSTINDLGARLGIFGQSVNFNSTLLLPSGRAELHASQGDVTLGANAAILVNGVAKPFADTVAYSPGGSIKLTATTGNVTAASTSTLDVSGGFTVDANNVRHGGAEAGTLDARAPQGSVTLDGTMRAYVGVEAAEVDEPSGGNFLFDTGTLGDFAALNTRLNNAGFSGARYLRVRNGDVIVADGDTVRAHEVHVVADNGAVNVAGDIDASGARGGRVELWASGNVVIGDTAAINASARGADQRGGTVLLATSGANNAVLDLQGGTIDVSGTGNQTAQSGELWLRAPRVSTNGVAIDDLDSEIVGAYRIVTEAFQVSNLTTDANGVATLSGTGGFDTTIAAGTRARLVAQLEAANSADPGIANRFHLTPGVEFRTPANATALNIDGTLSLNGLRTGDGEAGVLTIRSTGDLNVNQSISDGFSNATPTGVLSSNPSSWSYRLVAGADTGSADVASLARLEPAPLGQDPLAPLATGEGSLKLGADRLIRTGTGFIQLAAAGDIMLTNAGSVVYTAGAAEAALPTGFTPSSIAGVAPKYPSGGGSVVIDAQRNIYGREPGPDPDDRISNQLINDWLFREGRLNSNGTINRVVSWYPRFDRFKQGIGALGGGDVRVVAGGSIDNVSAVVPTNGRVLAANNTLPQENQLDVRGGGDLSVNADADIIGGVFYVGKGSGRLVAGGAVRPGDSIVSGSQNYERLTLLGIGASTIDVTAARGILLGNIFNPTLVPQISANLDSRTSANSTSSTRSTARLSQFSTFAHNTEAKLISLSGDVVLHNNTAAIQAIDNEKIPSATRYPFTGVLDGLDRGTATSAPGPTTLPSIVGINTFTVAPPSIRAAAFGGDVKLIGAPLRVFPASSGTLELLAATSVEFGASVLVSDLNPAGMPSPWLPVDSGLSQQGLNLNERFLGASDTTAVGINYFSSPSLHLNDLEPIRIVAVTGDITSSDTTPHFFPKRALLYAGRDIRNFQMVGQNLADTDVTSLHAGRDVVFELLDEQGGFQSVTGGIEIGGPGRVEVLAGRHVDLGASAGIRTVGNTRNPFLSADGADISVLAGVSPRHEYGTFIAAYFGSGSGVPDSERALYDAWLRDFMLAETGADLDTATALAQFVALPAERQRVLLHRVLFNEVDLAGKAGSDPKAEIFGNYARGYGAIDSMFPGYGAGHRGDIRLFLSEIKTERGGNIEMLAPGGSVDAGLAVAPRLSKDATKLGVVTLGPGDISAIVRDDFLVNTSRVFTLRGGGIMLWASHGDIDAGRGAKTTSGTNPPRLRLTSDNEIEFDLSGSVSGAGIGALEPDPSVPAGDTRLYAPEGTIRAGEAGIRAKNLTLTPRIEGGDNIQASKVNVALTDSGPGAQVAGAGDAASNAAKSTEDNIKSSGRSASEEEGANTFLDVEVTGFGDIERVDTSKTGRGKAERERDRR